MALVVIISVVVLALLYDSIRNPHSGAARALRASELERILRARNESHKALRQLTPGQFEEALAHLFRQMGFSATRTPAVNDGGWDVVAVKDGKTFLIEAKHYSPSNPVGRPAVMKLHSAVISEQANGGVVVTSGVFSKPAIEFAEKNGLTLVDGEMLVRTMSKAFPSQEDASLVALMCRRCGVRFSIPFDQEGFDVRCPSGHPVPNFAMEIRRTLSTRYVCGTCRKELQLVFTNSGHERVCASCNPDRLGNLKDKA